MRARQKTWRIGRRNQLVRYLTWSNWTFGIYWGRFGSRKTGYFVVGVDLGPIELAWKKSNQ